MPPVRVLIVDDHPKVRLSLRLGLDIWDEVTVVGEAGSGPEALKLAGDLNPDVVLMDLDMPGMDGAETTRVLCEQNPQHRILILTGTVDFSRIKVALAAGAVDYLSKTANLDEITAAVLEAANNHDD